MLRQLFYFIMGTHGIGAHFNHNPKYKEERFDFNAFEVTGELRAQYMGKAVILEIKFNPDSIEDLSGTGIKNKIEQVAGLFEDFKRVSVNSAEMVTEFSLKYY